jgi:hypothetical protein
MLLGEEQEVAYNSVLIERRKLLHERTAEGLQTLFADSIEEHLAELREFTIGLIRRVADGSEIELDRSLAALQAGEFIHEQPAFPEVEYIFKHALTQRTLPSPVRAAPATAAPGAVACATDLLKNIPDDAVQAHPRSSAPPP